MQKGLRYVYLIGAVLTLNNIFQEIAVLSIQRIN